MSGTVTELTVKPGDVVAAGAVLARIADDEASSAVSQARTQVTNAEEAVTRAKTSLNSTTTVPAAYLPAEASSPGPAPVGSASPVPGAPSPTSSRQPAPSPTGPGKSQPAAGGQGQPTNGAGGSSGTGKQGGTTGGSGDGLLSAERQLNEARLALKQAEAKLAGVAITAPVAGKILSVGGVLGGTATVSSSGFIVLAGTNDVAVQAEFTEAEVASLALGQPATITLPNQDDQRFAGSVLQISPQGTVSDKLVRYPAIIGFDAVPATLLYGQTANVAVVTAASGDVLYVPATAVGDRDGTEGKVSMRISGRLERRTVQIGLRGDVSTEIRVGLTEGEEILAVYR
jgi:multidrug efflux pump subunit AcrA (membrane-fusion protein)